MDVTEATRPFVKTTARQTTGRHTKVQPAEQIPFTRRDLALAETAFLETSTPMSRQGLAS
ncbi:MAG: hypothetical protein U1G08_08060 [Verrucomicrobiota bacterium]